VLAIANFTHRNSWCLVGRPNEPIKLGELRGKSIGVFTDSWTKAMMSFVLKKARLKESDVRQIITRDDDIALLLAKKIDIATQAAAYAVAKFQDVAHEQPALACNDAIGVPDIPIWAFTASPAWLRLHGTTAKSWLAATGDAIAWSVAHPSEAAKIYTQVYPSAGTLTYNAIGWTYEAGLMSGPDGFFKQNDSQWSVLAEALKETGQIASVKEPNAYYTNAFLPD
jgi:ABC-type nitrate/sulfonate/bicarbonate transport system substrate-binding protein